MNMKPRPSYPRTTPATPASGWDSPGEGPLSSSMARETPLTREPLSREPILQREAPVAVPAPPAKIVDVEEDDDDASHFVADERYEEIKRGS